jgi:hypothetical protein
MAVNFAKTAGIAFASLPLERRPMLFSRRLVQRRARREVVELCR